MTLNGYEIAKVGRRYVATPIGGQPSGLDQLIDGSMSAVRLEQLEAMVKASNFKI